MTELTRQEEDALAKLRKIRKKAEVALSQSSWDLGDWYNDHAHLNLARLCKKEGVSQSRAAMCAKTCTYFPKNFRQRKFLYSPCEEVNVIEDKKEREDLLDEAVKKKWSRTTLRRHIRKLIEPPKPEPTTVEKIREEGKKIDGHIDGIRQSVLRIRKLMGNNPDEIKALADMGLGEALKTTVTVVLKELDTLTKAQEKPEQLEG